MKNFIWFKMMFCVLLCACQNNIKNQDQIQELYIYSLSKALEGSEIIDTIFIVNQFYDFRNINNNFPEDLFYYGFLDEDSIYQPQKMDYNFWNTLLKKYKSFRNNIINYSDVGYININGEFDSTKLYIIFSPLYFNNKKDKGLFIISSINSLKFGTTKAFYIKKTKGIFKIDGIRNIHKFVPESLELRIHSK